MDQIRLLAEGVVSYVAEVTYNEVQKEKVLLGQKKTKRTKQKIMRKIGWIL